GRVCWQLGAFVVVAGAESAGYSRLKFRDDVVRVAQQRDRWSRSRKSRKTSVSMSARSTSECAKHASKKVSNPGSYRRARGVESPAHVRERIFKKAAFFAKRKPDRNVSAHGTGEGPLPDRVHGP